MSLRSLIEDRIRLTIPEFKEVSGGANMKAILNAAISTPGCYVFRERNRLSANTLINKVSQERTEQIGILVVTRNVQQGDRGTHNADENETLCDLIQAQLLGYTPSDDYSQIEYAESGGNLIHMQDGFLVWLEIYQSQRLLRSL